MARFYFLLLLLLPLCSAAQDKPFNYREFEGRIKKNMYTNPDSTRIILNSALQRKNLHDTIKANIYNIYGIYYGTAGKGDSAIACYKKSLVLCKTNPRMSARPLMNIANAYRNQGEFEQSFKYLDQGLEISRQYKIKSMEGLILGNYSSNYQYLQQYDKAVDFGLQSIAILKQEKDVGKLVTAQQKLANTYLKMLNLKFARDMYVECLASYKQLKDESNYSVTMVNYAECLIMLNEFDKAGKALETALVGLKKLNNPQHVGVVYSKIANIAAKKNNNTKAIDNYEKSVAVLGNSKSVHITLVSTEYIEFLNKIKRYDRALEVYESLIKMQPFASATAADRLRLDIAIADTQGKTNDDKAAIASLQKAVITKDSMNDVASNKRAREIQAKFQTEIQREKNLSLAAKNRLLQHDIKDSRNRIYIYAGAGLALILLVSLVLRAYFLKNRLQREQLKAIATDVALLQQQHQNEQEFTNSQREIIEEKQRELTSTALRMANYQDSIADFIKKCDAQGISKITDLKKELIMLVKQQDYWKQFETRFNTLHPDFGVALTNKYNKLTKNDIEFCSLLKLNLSNKEIASLLQISHESAITKKYRIKKKMEINDDQEFEKLLTAI
jgi:tetratricopeptide (TPR) repeat protein